MRIINDILDISKLEAGKLELEYLDFHLPSLLRDALNLFVEKRHDKRRKNLNLETRFEDSLPISVKSDPTRLRQILINLIGNAYKFTESGGVTIVGKRYQTDAGDMFFHIAVHDTGIGIRPEIINNLFSEFTQADASISRRFEGSGLGLSICRRLVEMMGGEIGVESEYGVGSTFWFTLPYIPAESEMIEVAPNITNKVSHHQANRPLNILVAEDNSLNQQIIEAIVNGFGHRTEIAEDGGIAIDAHRNHEYDLILMDIRMPKVSGVDATRSIRLMDGDKSSIPIIALTADAMEEHKIVYFEAGINEVVTKPIDRDLLAAAINDVMGEEIHTFGEVDSVAGVMESGKDLDQDNAEPNVAVDDFLAQIGALTNDT
jgi:two-component system, sensor histidine kinase